MAPIVQKAASRRPPSTSRAIADRLERDGSRFQGGDVHFPGRVRPPTSLALAGATALVAAALCTALLPVDVHHGSLLGRIALLNLILGLFNLLPVIPMDGGRVLHALLALRRGAIRATLVVARIGMVSDQLAIGEDIGGDEGGSDPASDHSDVATVAEDPVFVYIDDPRMRRSLVSTTRADTTAAPAPDPDQIPIQPQ